MNLHTARLFVISTMLVAFTSICVCGVLALRLFRTRAAVTAFFLEDEAEACEPAHGSP